MDFAYRKSKRKRWWRQGIGLLLWCYALFLIGCETRELHSNLLESDANAMLGVLLARDIQARKLQGKDKLFSVAVPKSQFAKAVELLQWYGIPQESFSGIGRMFSKSGIVSSPTEEKIRFMYALSQDIAETLSHLDGIVTSRVNLVLPKNNPYSEASTPSSASVFLKCRPGFDTVHLLPQIKALVMNSVEGLSYDRISVTVVESKVMDLYSPVRAADTMKKVLGIKVASDSVRVLWRAWSISLLVATVIGGIAGWGLFWLFKEIQGKKMVASSE
ncbi:MAG: type III secretion inner membrane ring lipoprotein SctJ [Candidatus Xiphinematobacter sp.]|nr:MAG: type III secretion inner membrane ring lipoprotein SctJ [Candidatus Xiphinematobacter sp.]QQY11436.1 MAG: type III secretion inner membrane ring lipoprotein SctJ [Candidatus Xiphinematobacter sp.]